MTRALGCTALAFVVSCAALRGSSGTPRIDRVVPDSVVMAPGAVIEIVIQGSGFAGGTPGRNTVRFGETAIANVPANDNGNEIRFTIPESVPSRGDAAPMPLESGRYALRVVTDAGESNAVNVRVDR
jgi:hypothetical protein